jgi:hypothetical protein
MSEKKKEIKKKKSVGNELSGYIIIVIQDAIMQTY